MPTKVHNLHKIKALLKRILHSLGVGPSTKQIIEMGLCERAKKIAFSNHKSHICLHVYIYIFSIFMSFLELFNFPKITQK